MNISGSQMKITTPKAVHRLIFIAGLLLVLPISASSAGGASAVPVPDKTLIEIREVAPGVHSVLAPPALRFADANSTVIRTGREIIVVDVPGRPDRAIALLDWIEAMADKPVRYLILTHWHGDHTQLAGLFVQRFPDLEIIAHPTLVEDLPGRMEPALAEEVDGLATALEEAEQRHRSGLNEQGESLAPDASEELAAAIGRARERLRVLAGIGTGIGTGIVRPTLLVPDELVLQRGERQIRILHLPGHTEGDLVVFLPREKVVITADLLDAIPFAGHGDLTRWIASLDALERLEFNIVIPGHGEPLHGKKHLQVVRDFLRSIRDEVNRLTAEGLALEETKGQVDVERFRAPLAGEEDLPNRAFDHFRDAAIERAWELLLPVSARDAKVQAGNEQDVSGADAPKGE